MAAVKRHISLPPAVLQTLGATAYAGFLARGCGAVVLDVTALVSAVPSVAPERFLSVAQLREQPWLAAADLVEVLATLAGYEPERAVVVVALTLQGAVEVHVVEPGAAHSPRALYESKLRELFGELPAAPAGG